MSQALNISLFYNLRKRLHNYLLSKKIAEINHPREMINLDEAHSIGLLYNASSTEGMLLVMDLKSKLERQGKRVTTLGYVNTSKPLESQQDRLFNNKTLNWYFQPKGKIIEQFINEPFDILFNAFIGDNIPLEYVAALSKAKLRVGEYQNNKTYCYELMINMGEKLELSYLLAQMTHFLKAINR